MQDGFILVLNTLSVAIVSITHLYRSPIPLTNSQKYSDTPGQSNKFFRYFTIHTKW